MGKTTIEELAEFGQSAWLDYLSRSLLDTGKLSQFIDKGLRGMTSNPSIFNQAIGSSRDYDSKIAELKNAGNSSFEIYDELTVKDIQDATDAFKPIYEKTGGLDGYVSLEINPLLANKVDEQIDEGLRLFAKVNRPNLMIKVPSTNQGFEVIQELISHEVNVNVTLIFSLQQYVKTVEAYLKGLNRLAEKKDDLSHVRSVASVFISRIDTAADAMLDEEIANEKDDQKVEQLTALKGKAAVANARIIYEKFKEVFAGSDFQQLFDKKANVQRVLWGSTSTKNPAYSDIKYVTELITKSTVNTIPEKTLEAFLDHGQVGEAFDYDVGQAQKIIDNLKEQGINIDHICSELLQNGIVAFNDAFEALLASIDKKAASLSIS